MASFLLLTIIAQYAFAEPYWGNLKVDVEKQERIEGETNDVVRIKVKLTNEDREEISIFYSYIVLEDSKNRQFSSSSYLELGSEGFRVTERECPWEFVLRLNPSISEETSLCYKVPKDHVEFILHFYESTPDYCKKPAFGSCQEKSVRLTVPPPSSSQIPPSSTKPQPSTPQTTVSNNDLQNRIKELEQKVNSLNSQITSKDNEISMKNREILAKDQQIANLKKQISEKDTQIKNKDAIILEQLKVISDLAKKIKTVVFNGFSQFFA